MNKSDVMRLVKRGPHQTSCWAWRGPLYGGVPTTRKEELIDPGKILGAESSLRLCGNRLCVNPSHRDGAQEQPRLRPPEKPPPKPRTKPKTLKLKVKQEEEIKKKAATTQKKAVEAPTTPPKAKPKAKPAPKAQKPAQAKPRARKSAKTKEKTHCSKGHPWIPENIWTSPTSGKSKCRVCERERKARAKAAKKKAAKK